MSAFLRVLLISLIAGSHATTKGTDFDIETRQSDNSKIATPDFSMQHHQESDFGAHKHGSNFDLRDHNEQADSYQDDNRSTKSSSDDTNKIHQDANSSQFSRSSNNSFESEERFGSGRPGNIPGHPNPFTPISPGNIPGHPNPFTPIRPGNIPGHPNPFTPVRPGNIPGHPNPFTPVRPGNIPGHPNPFTPISPGNIPGHPNPFTPVRPGNIPGHPNPFTPVRPSNIPGHPNPFTPSCVFGYFPIIPINPGCQQITCINFDDINFQNTIRELIDTKIIYIEQKSKTKESVVTGFEEILAKFKSILIQSNKAKLEIQSKKISEILVILKKPEYQVVCQSLGLTQDILSAANASFILDIFARVQQLISSTARISFNEYLTRSSVFGFNTETIISSEFSEFERFVSSCSTSCNSPLIIGSKRI